MGKVNRGINLRSEHPLRNYYRCRDGRWLRMALTPAARFWGTLRRALGHPELEEDPPRFQSEDCRLTQAEPLVSLFDKIFATDPVKKGWRCLPTQPRVKK